MKRYFYITIHFSPEYEGTVLARLKDDLYINTETGETYRKRALYDFGWGQESGFELMPPLSFKELIKLVEQPGALPQKKRFRRCTSEEFMQADIWRSNLYGAAAVIMQDHAKEFIEFLAAKIETDYFSDPSIRENFRLFSFDSQKTRDSGAIPGGVLTRSYEEILSAYPQWETIASGVIDQVYK